MSSSSSPPTSQQLRHSKSHSSGKDAANLIFDAILTSMIADDDEHGPSVYPPPGSNATSRPTSHVNRQTNDDVDDGNTEEKFITSSHKSASSRGTKKSRQKSATLIIKPSKKLTTSTIGDTVYHHYAEYKEIIAEESNDEIVNDHDELLRDREIDRIYGVGRAGVSVRKRMEGSFLQNPTAEPFRHLVNADIAETRTAEHLAKQNLRRKHISNRLEREKDFIVERSRDLTKELAEYGIDESYPRDYQGIGFSTMKLGGGDVRYKGDDDDFDGAPGRHKIYEDLSQKLPGQLNDFQRRKSEYERKFYHHNVRYQGEMGMGTYEPWQLDDVKMIRNMVLEMIELILNAYEGKEENTNKEFQYGTVGPTDAVGGTAEAAGFGQREQQNYGKHSPSRFSLGAISSPRRIGEPYDGDSGEESKGKIERQREGEAGGQGTMHQQRRQRLQQQQRQQGETIPGQRGTRPTSPAAKKNWEQKREEIKQKSERIRKTRQKNLDNSALEKIAQLESEKGVFEVTKEMVVDVADEQLDLSRICHEFARSSIIKMSWALANEESSVHGNLPDNKTTYKMENLFNQFLYQKKF